MNTRSEVWEPLTTVCSSHLQACSDLAQLMLEGLERVGRIGLQVAREGAQVGLDAASQSTRPDSTRGPAFDLEPFARAQREVLDTLFDIGQRYSVWLGDYVGTIGRAIAARAPVVLAWSGSYDPDAAVRLLSEASAQLAAMTQADARPDRAEKASTVPAPAPGQGDGNAQAAGD